MGNGENFECVLIKGKTDLIQYIRLSINTWSQGWRCSSEVEHVLSIKPLLISGTLKFHSKHAKPGVHILGL